MKEYWFWFIPVLLVLVVAGVLMSIEYHFNKASCYDKAQNYETHVESYSFLKNYCFVKMDGKTVNLENYRDTNEVK